MVGRNKTMSLCFHIIYTPGTVKPLRLLLYSLLKWSDCTFHLVANGCSPDETADLAHFCAGNPRLVYQALPTDKVLLHGEALNYLQAQNQHSYFCFMDSDIYAVDHFLPTFLPDLAHYRAISSAMPLRYPQTGWIASAEQEFLAGPISHTQDGLCVGTTFFAIYENAVVSKIREATGISFRKYRWEEIPVAYQDALQAIGAKHQLYDTAKLLNLLLRLQGHALHYQPCAALRHIEAVSRFAVIQQRSPWARVRAWAGQWRRRLAGQTVRQSYDEALPYLSKLLLALVNDKPLPPQPVLYNQTESAWVAEARRELLALHREFGQSRGGR